LLAPAALERLLPQVVTLAERAGAAIIQVYDSADSNARLKADSSPVTDADLRANQLIVEALQELTPDVPIISEEQPLPSLASRAHWEEHWLVDPLDGTKEFLARNGEFTVNIALIQRHLAQLGVVHVPVRHMTYRGLLGYGAWRSGAQQNAIAIHVESQCPERPRVLGSRSHHSVSLDAVLAKLGDYQLVIAGSSLKFCLLAEGRADFYPRLSPTSEWDTAAGQAVLEAAGGCMTTLTGEPFQYNLRADCVNPGFLAFADRSRDWSRLVNDGD